MSRSYNPRRWRRSTNRHAAVFHKKYANRVVRRTPDVGDYKFYRKCYNSYYIVDYYYYLSADIWDCLEMRKKMCSK